MKQVLEVDEQRSLHLGPAELGEVDPHDRYTVEVLGETLILRPEKHRPLWETATPQERAEAIRRWASLPRPPAPALSDEALRRENIYEAGS
jgi:hypothetical protein